MDALVTTDWLSRHLDDPDLVVLDCSVYQIPDAEKGFKNVSGRAEYERGHIPSAGFADLKGGLSDLTSPHEFAVPAPEQFCETMGALGVGDDSRVVLYDGSGMGWATRVWWMLRWVGFDRAAVLDGGLGVWVAEERPIANDSLERSVRRLGFAIRPWLIADRDEVLAAIGDPAVSLIDVMPKEFYRGEETLYARPGHIPTASNVSVLELFDESGRFRSHDELVALFPGDRHARTITYCGGGIAASATAFVLTRLGFTDVAVYTASLQEWAADACNPMVVGAGAR